MEVSTGYLPLELREPLRKRARMNCERQRDDTGENVPMKSTKQGS